MIRLGEKRNVGRALVGKAEGKCVRIAGSVVWGLGYGLESRRGQGFYLFCKKSRLAVGRTQPPVHWVLCALYPRVDQPGSELSHLPVSRAEVKNEWSYTSNTHDFVACI
jgi:hypothetical protein